MARTPLAAVVVPTHDHAATLDLAVRSALAQSVQAIEVLVVGDGVGDDTRDVVAGLRHHDDRVRFLDLPKGPHHGEVHRGTAIMGSEAEVVCYCCDDDLLLPDHVADMRDALAGADLVQGLNGYIEPGGGWQPYFGDLGSATCREWVLRPDRNVISLTGTAHTAAAYRRLPHGWRTTPAGRWPDHFMFQQFLAEPWVRAATVARVTALQFPSHLGGRADWSPARRRAELEHWLAAAGEPGFRARFDAEVLATLSRVSTAQYLELDRYQAVAVFMDQRAVELVERAARSEEGRAAADGRAREAAGRAAAAEAAVAAASAETDRVRADLTTVTATRTWQLRSWALRSGLVRRMIRRVPGRGPTGGRR